MSATLFDILRPVAPISPQTKGQAVYDRFQAEPDTLALAVVDETGQPVGIVERNDFFLAMAAHYGRALYALRPISLLMTADPVTAEGDTPVAEFCAQVLVNGGSELLKGFIVTLGGRYAGVGSTLSLLRATAAANQAHAEEMTRARLEAQAALSAKSQFLGVMSHEIRTPLNGVLAIADILERKLTQAELRPYVATIQDSGQTLLRLLTDALDLTRADAGRLELAEDGFCVPALVEDLAALWGPRAELKKLSLTFTYDGPPEQWALGDPVRIKQVFNNLIGNALKFTDTGGVEVTLRVRREDIYLHLDGAVLDTGIGVPQERLQTIFQPFSQTEAGLREGGAGLGLAICRQLVEQMGGAIEAFRNPDLGSTFRFSFPLFDLPAPAEDDDVEQDGQTADLLGGVHVLIADDNPTNRLVAETLCAMFGCTTESVEDGEQAATAAAGGRFDLILMDIKMPRLDGVGATRRIRALAGAAAEVPILALTANADPWDAAGYLAQGMDGVVEKPIKAERLLEAMAAALDGERSAAVAA